MSRRLLPAVLGFIPVLCQGPGALAAAPHPTVPQFSVHELVFEGPPTTARDSPARDVELYTLWRHESGTPELRVAGFWDGDGRGGRSGNVYKVRFCPVEPGEWTLVRTSSNRDELRGRREGYRVTCRRSDHPGFWVPDPETSGRWYKRQDGTHPYIIGDTLYSFLSEYRKDRPTGGNIRNDVVNTSRYFRKIRFSISGDRYPHPETKPFLDEQGKPTDEGRFSHRPNPEWFHQRVDLAVQTAYEQDLIADLILCGPDAYESRSILKAKANGGDATPFLRYMAARYGSFPNVWFCLCNEFDIKRPSYSAAEIVSFGSALRGFLAYPCPMSVHARPRDWDRKLNSRPWHDHVIIQKKLKKLQQAADWVSRNHALGGGKPVIDDELAYEGAGDGWSENDVIESHLGAFLGGGYGTTGHKPASKEGHYFWGHFKPEEHRAADNLLWLREQIDRHIAFWRMQPAQAPGRDGGSTSIFENVPEDFRALEWPGREYVLGTNHAHRGIRVRLQPGRWTIVRYDACSRKREVLAEDKETESRLDAPSSRAVFFHVSRQ